MTSQPKRRRAVFLPWERRRAWLRAMISGRRWQALLLSALALGTLAVIWHAAQRRTRMRLTRAAIAEVHRAIEAFRVEVGRCPRSTVELVHPPKAGADYLKHLPDDGWGRPLYVRCPHPEDPEGAEVISAGPSGSFLRDDNVF